METITLSQIHWELIAGGLGIFLYGIHLMGDGLTNFAGTKIRDYIDKYTSNPLMAILVGIILTGILQSSSATTVIAISLVRSGLMRLDQAIGISMGANIGTTVTAILISFNVEYFSYFILLAGVILSMVAAKKKYTYLSQIIIGFAFIFVGLTMMSGELKQFQYIAGFNDIIARITEHPIFGLIGGTLVTGVVQSSSAVIGIIQKLYEANGVTLIAAISVVLGANIGTCVTSVIASIGGSLASRRAAYFHLSFNIIGSILFMILLVPFTGFIEFITAQFEFNKLMSIASAHFLFNFICTLLFLPFIRYFVKLMEIILPGKDSNSLSDIELEVLDEGMITTFPAGALGLSKRTIFKMGELVLNSIESSRLFLETKDKKYFDSVQQLEDIINNLDTKVTEYLLKISRTQLTDDLSTEYATHLQVVKNLERISDLSQNLAEFYEMLKENNASFTDVAMDELRQLYDLLIHNLTSALKIYESGNFSSYNQLSEDENQMDLLESQFRENYFQRISTIDTIPTVATAVYVDILGTLERMADHSFNIATNTVYPVKIHQKETTNLGIIEQEIEKL